MQTYRIHFYRALGIMIFFGIYGYNNMFCSLMPVIATLNYSFIFVVFNPFMLAINTTLLSHKYSKIRSFTLTARPILHAFMKNRNTGMVLAFTEISRSTGVRISTAGIFATGTNGYFTANEKLAKIRNVIRLLKLI